MKNLHLQFKTSQEIFETLTGRNDPSTSSYLKFYSSWFKGWTDVPGLMVLPVDDHQVHRGDAVFEAFRFSAGAIYDLEGHLNRLERSAKAIGLELPFSKSEIKEILISLTQSLTERELLYRLFVSRGPGGFSPDPRECLAPQLYIVVNDFKGVNPLHLQNGVTVKISQWTAKPAPFHEIKSCNYLENVLMKMEAIEAKVDYCVSRTDEGYIGEGPTENILFLMRSGELLAPSLSYVLRGTTLVRVLELAEGFKTHLGIKSVRWDHISETEVSEISEAAMVGTTAGVLPVATFEASPLKSCGEHSVMNQLRALLLEDMRTNNNRRTKVT